MSSTAIILGIWAVSATFAGFMLIRNDWVYSQRVRLIWEDHRAYRRLPSYDAMLWQFWIWDIAKFKARPLPDGGRR